MNLKVQATSPEGEIAIGLHVSGSTVATGSSLRADLTSPSVPGAGAAMVASKLLGTRLVYIKYICIIYICIIYIIYIYVYIYICIYK